MVVTYLSLTSGKTVKVSSSFPKHSVRSTGARTESSTCGVKKHYQIRGLVLSSIGHSVDEYEIQLLK